MADHDKDWLDRSSDLLRHLSEGSNRLRYLNADHFNSTGTILLDDPALSLKYLYEEYTKQQITRLIAKKSDRFTTCG